MAIGANSYGSVAEVEALVPQYAVVSNEFDATTRPTLVQVEKFIDRVSAALNLLLAEAGFAVPVSQADALLVLDHFVVVEAVSLCEEANEITESFQRERRTVGDILEGARSLVEQHASGFEQLGATRDRAVTYGLGYWDTDDAGDDIEPVFSRKMMDQTIVDWDSE